MDYKWTIFYGLYFQGGSASSLRTLAAYVLIALQEVKNAEILTVTSALDLTLIPPSTTIVPYALFISYKFVKSFLAITFLLLLISS